MNFKKKNKGVAFEFTVCFVLLLFKESFSTYKNLTAKIKERIFRIRLKKCEIKQQKRNFQMLNAFNKICLSKLPKFDIFNFYGRREREKKGKLIKKRALKAN